MTQLILWLVLIFAMLVVGIPFIFLGTLNLWLGVIPGVGFCLLIIALSSAYFGVFASSVWTLGFMRMTGLAGTEAVMVAGTTPPADPHGGSNSM
ncbi:MAG: hypothetical protein ACE5K8_08660 [Candidatus Zixiibacteriota bacterium]